MKISNSLYSILLAFTLIFPSSCIFAQNKTPFLQNKDSSAIISSLNNLIPNLMEENKVPGLSIAVVKNGRMIANIAYGIKNTKTGEKVNTYTVFEAASLSKPVFAYYVLKLVDSGEINLDKPLADYLGFEYVKDDIRIKDITARMVLTHSPGFPNWRPNGKELKIIFTPGSKFSYSGEGFVYLQKVVEKIKKQPLNNLIKEHVFDPLEMNSSSYLWLDQYEELTAYGHNKDGEYRGKRKGQRNGNAAASLHTTSGDYAKFLTALLNKTGLSSKMVEQLFKPQIKMGKNREGFGSNNLNWGLGIGVEVTEHSKYIWHWGDNMNFKCFVIANTNDKNGLVYFTNGYNGLRFSEEIVSKLICDNHAIFNWLGY